MADIDDAIDALYRGPLDAFTDARNALARSAKRADVKALAKPSLPAWAVNQLHWHQRASIDRLVAAAEALRAEHGKMLAGRAADIAAAERTHREVLREVLAEAKAILVGAGHPATAATLDAVRETLQVLPSPEANGRLVRALSPQGFAALAGFAVAPARPNLRVVASKSRDAARAAAAAEAEAEAEAERARARKQAEREERARKRVAEKALEAARVALRKAEIALDDAERLVKSRRAERDTAAAAHERAERDLRD